ncbi:pyridoxine/pyridoxamine 5'-phosphate oxidase-like [Musca autumnalis]|uniref:pyridoxine/pyridoxamine 5'-phosphate oxidase-like n=1 Tax=Musca autumnalis TaxID=221902 RepID=UPI003CE80AA3
MNKVKNLPRLARIRDYPSNPLQMFRNILECVNTKSIIPMNLATLDNEFGVLNRTVVYRGLLDDSWIWFATERNSRKYQNLKDNPKLALTILLQNVEMEKDLPQTWQIRLLSAEAEEVNDDEQLKVFWKQEPLFQKIRSHICVCGKPSNLDELDAKFKEQLAIMDKEKREPEMTKTYTAFKIIPKHWDFYMAEPNAIGDRVQYKQLENGEWEAYHVDD